MSDGRPEDIITREVAMVVPIRPMGKPRMTRRDRWKKRPVVERYHAWCDALRDHVGSVPPAGKIMRLVILAQFQTPKRYAARIGTLHRMKPDIDNIEKAVMDALWKDDSGIADARTRKEWAAQDCLRIGFEVVVAAPGAA